MLMNLQSGAKKSSKAVAMDRASAQKTTTTKQQNTFLGMCQFCSIILTRNNRMYMHSSTLDLHEHSLSPQSLESASLSIRTAFAEWCRSPTQKKITSEKFMLREPGKCCLLRVNVDVLRKMGEWNPRNFFSQQEEMGWSPASSVWPITTEFQKCQCFSPNYFPQRNCLTLFVLPRTLFA